ncbi:hypothetical protein H1R20_g8005, partial [Candolleomyces eurysporus]
MSTAQGRGTHARAILGPELYAKLADTHVLLVGAGGIGCELHSFLFRKKDVKQSKALVAAQTASAFNPNVKILPIHDNIKEPQYDIPWFQQFDLVLNALDNLDARRHVNRMCMAGNVPLVESGTAGYLGQVQPLLKDKTECFDCIPKPTPKTFPVCTIRSTPSQPIHCIVWSKTYLMGQLFGEDEDATGELDAAEKEGENAQEIAALRKEATAFKIVRDALRSKNSEDAAELVFRKVFDADIRNLLSMADMWKSRSPPVPLDLGGIMNDSFVLRQGTDPHTNGASASTSKVPNPPAPVNGQTNGPAPKLKDQQTLSLKDNVLLFIDSTNRLANRLRNGEETISFDKDDDDTLDFVTAASNLRSSAMNTEMAGNIIPAIATTNAVVSGLIVLQALHLLRKSHDKLRNVYLQFKPAVPLSTISLSKPNDQCGVCRDTYTLIRCDPSRAKLGEVVKGLLGDDDREVSVYEGQRVLSDPDWDDNYDRTLESLSVTRGKFLAVVDEDGELSTISVGVAPLPDDHPADGPSYILPSPLPQPTRRIKPPPPPPETPQKANGKRLLPVEGADGVIDLAPTPKKPKFSATAATISSAVTSNGKKRKAEDTFSPSKKRRLEEDGLILMDGADDKLEGEPEPDFILIDD